MKKGILKNRLLSLLIGLLALAMAAVCVACTDKPDDGEEPTDQPEKTLISEGASEYFIVRNDYLSTASEEVKGAVALHKALVEAYSADVPVKTDYTGKGGEPETQFEILVGKTAREASGAAYETLDAHEFLIKMTGDKLLLLGRSEHGTALAVSYFIEHYVDAASGKLSLPENLEYKGEYQVNYKVAIPTSGGTSRYDTVLAVACIQGIMNREAPEKVYVVGDGAAQKWLDVMTDDDHWMRDMEFEEIKSFKELLEVARPYIKEIILWDTDVPASVNVATTMAGVEDGVVMEDSFYRQYKDQLEGVKVVNLNGEFTGAVTGSAKNDAYRWAIENYLAKGLCSRDFICYYSDSYFSRSGGDTAYISVRDWAVYNRSFVYDLSPWGDEVPFDDPDQPVGTDLETYELMLNTQYELNEKKKTYEVCGFFNFTKYSHWAENTASHHETVPTEWESVWVISKYGGYQNTTTEWCWNQSLHSQAPMDGVKFENNRPDEMMTLEKDKVYLCMFMADYDASYPLYNFLQSYWADPKRGEIPLAWGINPSLIDTYPDIIQYYYETKTPNDYFTSDASAAGYFNPSRVPSDFWDVMTAHNVSYFERLNMSIAPMILDFDKLDTESLDAFYEFAPDGIATIIIDQHGDGGRQAQPFVYMDEMVCDELLNCGPARESSVEDGIRCLENAIGTKPVGTSKFALVRTVWTTPSYICEIIDAYREKHPDVDLEVVDIYNYFNLRKQALSK